MEKGVTFGNDYDSSTFEIQVKKLSKTAKAFHSGRMDQILPIVRSNGDLRIKKPAYAWDLINTTVGTQTWLYSWGTAYDFQLGYLKDKQAFPKKVEIDEDVVSIETDKFHSMAVTKSGQVLTFGNGKGGRLGLGNQDDVVEPMIVPVPVQVAQIALSENHSICLTKDGSVYSWGDNRFGQLGHLDVNEVFSPMLCEMVRTTDRAIQVAAGANHSAFLTWNRRVFIFGDRRDGQHVIPTGTGTTVLTGKDACRGEQCKVIYITADRNHTCIVLDTGKIIRTVSCEHNAVIQLSEAENICQVRTCDFATFILYDYNVLYYSWKMHENTFSKVQAVDIPAVYTIYAKKDKACLVNKTGDLYTWKEGKFARNFDVNSVVHAAECNFHTFSIVGINPPKKWVCDPLESLMALSEINMISLLDLDNAAILLLYADALSCERMKWAAIEYIETNMKAILMKSHVETLYQLPPELLKLINVQCDSAYSFQILPQSERKMSKNSESSVTKSPAITPELPVSESPLPETTKIRTQSFNATYTAPEPPKWQTKSSKSQMKEMAEYPTLGAQVTPPARERANTDTFQPTQKSPTKLSPSKSSKRMSQRQRRKAEQAKNQPKPSPPPKQKKTWNTVETPKKAPDASNFTNIQEEQKNTVTKKNEWNTVEKKQGKSLTQIQEEERERQDMELIMLQIAQMEFMEENDIDPSLLVN